MSADDILELARQVIAGKSRSYVNDAAALAKAYLDLYTNHASYCISPETYLALEARLRVAERALTKCAGHLSGEALQDMMIARVAISEPADPPPVANYKQALANLDAAQAAGTKLQLEVQPLKGALRRIREIAATLPGGGDIIDIVNKALGL